MLTPKLTINPDEHFDKSFISSEDDRHDDDIPDCSIICPN